jgi:predicted nucleic acid-binding protein
MPKLYHRVICPEVVLQECSSLGAPSVVRAWAENPPDWLEIRKVFGTSRAELGRLDPGERSAIELALKERATTVLMDELAGRQAARHAGLIPVGTIGILAESAHNGWIDYSSTVARLPAETNFRVTTSVIELGRRHAQGR